VAPGRALAGGSCQAPPSVRRRASEPDLTAPRLSRRHRRGRPPNSWSSALRQRGGKETPRTLDCCKIATFAGHPDSGVLAAMALRQHRLASGRRNSPTVVRERALRLQAARWKRFPGRSPCSWIDCFGPIRAQRWQQGSALVSFLPLDLSEGGDIVEVPGAPSRTLHPDQVVERNDRDFVAVEVDDQSPLAHLIEPARALRFLEDVDLAVTGKQGGNDRGEALGFADGSSAFSAPTSRGRAPRSASAAPSRRRFSGLGSGVRSRSIVVRRWPCTWVATPPITTYSTPWRARAAISSPRSSGRSTSSRGPFIECSCE